MSPSDREQDVRRLAEASVWRMRLSEADVESSAEFEGWLASDQANLSAWKRVQASWNITEDFTTAPELMSARRDALNRARLAGGKRWRTAKSSRRWAGGGLIAAAFACVALVVFFVTRSAEVSRYETGLGEHRTVALADGSHVLLDAGTQLDVRYLRRARQVHLVRGQARFEVTHDPARPFIVRAGDQSVLAVGTDFNVNLLGQSVLVALIQGRVMVTPSALPGAEPIMLSPGQQLVASPSKEPYVEAINVQSVTAWQADQLIFHDEPLGSVVVAVSRYSEHALLPDQDVIDLRISGVFKEGDIATFVDVITHYLPVQATTLPNGTVLLRRQR